MKVLDDALMGLENKQLQMIDVFKDFKIMSSSHKQLKDAFWKSVNLFHEEEAKTQQLRD